MYNNTILTEDFYVSTNLECANPQMGGNFEVQSHSKTHVSVKKVKKKLFLLFNLI